MTANDDKIAQGVSAVRERAGVMVRSDLYTLAISGPDRVSYLNGMLSNDVARLQPGQGQLAVKATPKGRIEGLVRLRAEEERIALDVIEASAQRVATALVQYHVSEDCEISDATDDRDVVTIIGPEAKAIIERAGLGNVAELSDHAFTRLGELTVVRDTTFGVRGYELFVPPGRGAEIAAKLETAGAAPISAEVLDVVRVESGVPLDGKDLDLDTFPMEARLDHAISSSKGCYVGQEVIARGTIQGQVNYLLVGVVFGEGQGEGLEDAQLFVPGQDKDVGELSSLVFSPTMRRWIALGYVRRTLAEPGTELEARSGSAKAECVVEPLPFVS